MIIKCTSCNVSKARLKVNFGYSFQTTKLPCKMRHPDIKRNFFVHELSKISRGNISCKSMRRTKQERYKCTSFNTRAHKKIDEYRIENELIRKEIINFRKIAGVFLNLYNGKNYGKTIDIKSDSVYIVLKFHEKKIKSIEQFMNMKVKEVIPDELFFSLSCL
ncbi:MAG: hypothetical protein ACRC5F_00350 [Cetobacterium sp.]